MQKKELDSVDRAYNIQVFFDSLSSDKYKEILKSENFERISWDLSSQDQIILDRFSDVEGASCAFLRFNSEQARKISLFIEGGYQLKTCPSGGWLLQASNDVNPSFWIPNVAMARKSDSFGRILSEQIASISKFETSSEGLLVELEISDKMHLDLTIWRFYSKTVNVLKELENPLVLEKQKIFFWTSETSCQSPADLYLYLINGQVYTNRFIWPRNWKMCSELDAYGLYVTFNGLESATDKKLYDLLKRQLLISVIARQAEDGAWYHGEWTDYMESHYRLHNGAMLLLEAALKERPDEVVSQALARGADFISKKTDDIDQGLWFLHDSLEDSHEMMVEMCRLNRSNWIQKPVLGKSATNKLIFNTHLDTIISLSHYRDVSGDNQYTDKVDSARDAVRGILALRPAEMLYSWLYKAIKLTLLPEQEARKLPLIMRAIKRITWKYITPNLYLIKNIYPRLVMPGGYIERHLGMGHYDVNYHPINVLDLVRYWRCFPDEDLSDVLNDAISAVSKSSILDFWAERESSHKSLVEWVDAIFQLCTLKQDLSYRQLLSEGVIKIEERGIGLPPSILGADPEAVDITQRYPCPSPDDPRLRVVNLSCAGRMEIIVVNSTSSSQNLAWQENKTDSLSWFDADGRSIPSDSLPLYVPARGWVWGK